MDLSNVIKIRQIINETSLNFIKFVKTRQIIIANLQ